MPSTGATPATCIARVGAQGRHIGLSQSNSRSSHPGGRVDERRSASRHGISDAYAIGVVQSYGDLIQFDYLLCKSLQQG